MEGVTIDRIAVIDIGTNSVLMLIAETDMQGHLIPVARLAETTRLGGNIRQTGKIHPDNLSATVEALLRYRTIAQKHAVRHLVTVGTQVFRLAKNRRAVCGHIHKETGLTVRILSGNEEAAASFLGAISGSWPDNSLVIDIGGGSTELALGKGRELTDWISLPFGAVVLTEQWIHTDPPDKEACSQIRAHVFRQVPENWKSRLGSAESVVCVGGTVTTLAALHLGLSCYDAEKVNDLELSYEDIQTWLEKFCSCALRERCELIQFDPGRADIIIAGLLILETLIQISPRKKVGVSDAGLRHGIALQEFGKIKRPDLISP
ncbi:Ppx/GppA family phosphatase [bacterium]|nr:Ppx/GppA family phosphatase [bacterium]